ncbi:hypothetical protein TWF281_011041 [Arthrobotrys megalospora]
MAAPMSSIEPTADDLILLQSVAASLGVPISLFLQKFLGPQIIDDPPSVHSQPEYTKEQFSLFLKAAAILKVPIWQFLEIVSVFPSTNCSTATSSATLGSSSPETTQSNVDVNPQSPERPCEPLIQLPNAPEDDAVIHPTSISSIEPLADTRDSTDGQGGVDQTPGVSHSLEDFQQGLDNFNQFLELSSCMGSGLELASIEKRSRTSEARWNETPYINIGFDNENLILEFDNGAESRDALISFDGISPQNPSETTGLWSPHNAAGVDDAVNIPLDVFMTNTFAEASTSLTDNSPQIVDCDNGAASQFNNSLVNWQMLTLLPSCVANNIFSPAMITQPPESQPLSTMNDFLADPIPEEARSMLAEAVEKSKSGQRKGKNAKAAAVAGPKANRIEKAKAPPTDMALRPKRATRTKVACMRCKFNKNKVLAMQDMISRRHNYIKANACVPSVYQTHTIQAGPA